MAPSPREAIKAQLGEALDRAQLPELLHEQASAVLMKASAEYDAWPWWPIAELPRRAALAVGAPEAIARQLAVSAVLFYAASDIIDDAQDGELAEHPFWDALDWGWQHAVNAGNLLIFLSGATLQAIEAPASARAAWARAFAEAGVRLAAGQHRDFLASPRAELDEAALEAITRDKAGAGWACLASLGPLWAGSERLDRWRAFGEKLGTLYQLVSDVWPYVQDQPHRDLAVGKLTLPLLAARDADPGILRLFEPGRPLGEDEQAELRRRALDCGAVMYAEMRVEILRKEAQELLAHLEPEATDLLIPLIEQATLRAARLSGA